MKGYSKLLIAVSCVLLVAGAATWLALVYPVRKAERTEIGTWGSTRFTPLSSALESAAEAEVGVFEIDCDQQKYLEGGWLGKLTTARVVNYWSDKAHKAQEAFQNFDEQRKFKAAGIAASDAIRYWSSVSYAKEELECYDVVDLQERKPY